MEVYTGPFVDDAKHGTAEVLIDRVPFVARYERGVLKNIMTKQESLNTICAIF